MGEIPELSSCRAWISTIAQNGCWTIKNLFRKLGLFFIDRTWYEGINCLTFASIHRSLMKENLDVIVPYAESSASKKEQVASMFNNISHSYDRLNRILSFGIDIWWRKKAIATLREGRPSFILDIATGTGDLAIEALSLKPEKIIGVDISEGMLNAGRKKLHKLGLTDKIDLRSGDSENLDFPENHFDAVMVSFGVRNFENLEKGLGEILRVLKPGGKLMVLEFSKPKNSLIRFLYGIYNNSLLPLTGRLLSKDKAAYTYLPESVQAFPEGLEFIKILTKQGFQAPKALPLTFGISTIYTGIK